MKNNQEKAYTDMQACEKNTPYFQQRLKIWQKGKNKVSLNDISKDQTKSLFLPFDESNFVFRDNINICYYAPSGKVTTRNAMMFIVCDNKIISVFESGINGKDIFEKFIYALWKDKEGKPSGKHSHSDFSTNQFLWVDNGLNNFANYIKERELAELTGREIEPYIEKPTLINFVTWKHNFAVLFKDQGGFHIKTYDIGNYTIIWGHQFVHQPAFYLIQEGVAFVLVYSEYDKVKIWSSKLNDVIPNIIINRQLISANFDKNGIKDHHGFYMSYQDLLSSENQPLA